MKCPKCERKLAITKVIKPSEDGVVCVHCHHVVPSHSITWSDGLFHFNVVGNVNDKKSAISPRLLMENQTIKTLDLGKIRERAKHIISEQPNLRAICQEFFIGTSDIFIELIQEK